MSDQVHPQAHRASAHVDLGPILSRLKGGFLATVQHMQHARMVGVLQGMTDRQLAEMGIARKEIFGHAAKLVGLKFDH